MTAGGDKGFDTAEFVMECRHLGVRPHVAQNTGRLRGSAIDTRKTRHPGQAVGQRKRKRIEERFGRIKDIALLRTLRHRGLAKVGWIVTSTVTEPSFSDTSLAPTHKGASLIKQTSLYGHTARSRLANLVWTMSDLALLVLLDAYPGIRETYCPPVFNEYCNCEGKSIAPILDSDKKIKKITAGPPVPGHSVSWEASRQLTLHSCIHSGGSPGGCPSVWDDSGPREEKGSSRRVLDKLQGIIHRDMALCPNISPAFRYENFFWGGQCGTDARKLSIY